MKPTNSSQRLPLKRGIRTLVAGLLLAISGGLQAQSLISSADFYNPDFEARRPGGNNVLDLTITAGLYNPGSQTAGNVTWTHQAGGLVQAGLAGIADVQLAAITRTEGNSLVFGRELETDLLGLPDLGGLLNGVVNNVVGASVINQWNSAAEVGGLTLSEGVLYSASFTVTTGAGLNLNALSSANFSLLSGGTVIEDINSVETLNVLDLLTVGSGLANINFLFYAPAGGADELTFEFDAATIANVNLLGSISGNQDVMTFSNFSLAPVPEPGSLLLASVGFLALLRRRRPCHV